MSRGGNLASRAWRNRFVRLGAVVVKAGFALGGLRPLQPRVLLATQRSTDLRGNLLYVRRGLEKRTEPIPFVVLAFRTRPGLRGRLKGIGHAFKAGYHLATARVCVIDDWFFPMDVITPRRGTIRVQTWHAAGSFKKVGYSVLDKTFGADESMVDLVPIHSNYDLCVMASTAATVDYMDAFRLPVDRFTAELGYPRTDLFFDNEHGARAIAAIRARYALPLDRKVLLYGPTFRGDTVSSARYDNDLDLTVMQEALADDWVVLLRLHPFVQVRPTIEPSMETFAIDVSDWPDMNELMLISDLLVTDYSSAIFEFALLHRPMAFLAPDSDAYERERGFYFDYRSNVPRPVFETTLELAAYVRAGNFDIERSVAFARASFDVADGHSTERFVDRVVVPGLKGEPPKVHPPEVRAKRAGDGASGASAGDE